MEDIKRLSKRKVIEMQHEDCSGENRTRKEMRLTEFIRARYSRVTLITSVESNLSDFRNGNPPKLLMERYLYNTNAPGANNLRTLFSLKSLECIEKIVTSVFRNDMEGVKRMVRMSCERNCTCPIERNCTCTEDNEEFKLNTFFYIFIQGFLEYKKWYCSEISLIRQYLPCSDLCVILHYELEKPRRSNVHIGPVFKRLNPKRKLLTQMDLQILLSAITVKISRKKLHMIFRRYRESKHHFNFLKFLEEFASVISDWPATYCRHCCNAKSGHTTTEETEYEKRHFHQPLGTKNKFSSNLVLKIMECNHYARVPIHKCFEDFDTNRSGLCGRTQFVEGCSRVLTSIKKKISLNTSFQDLVALLHYYQLPGSHMFRWKDFENETSCGCNTTNANTELYYVFGDERNSQNRPIDSSSDPEEGTVIWADEEKETEPEKSLKQETHEKITVSNPKLLWHNSTIEMVGSVPSTSAIWDKYCDKFTSSSEESFIQNQVEVLSIPLVRKCGHIDLTKTNSTEIMMDSTNDEEEIKSKYVRREQYGRDCLYPLSVALIKFRKCLSIVVGDCISYVRCLDPWFHGGSVPRTSSIWERYCDKFTSSSEESFIQNQVEVHSIPLVRKYGYIDLTKVNSTESTTDSTNDEEEITSKYMRLEQYGRDRLYPLSVALIKFRKCLSIVVGDCMSYVRCLDPEQTGYICFEEFVEVLVSFGIHVDDDVIFELQEWFGTAKGLDYRSLMEALYELEESQEEMECQSDEVDEMDEMDEEATTSTYQEERESQDMSLNNVMEQYEVMTDNALMRIRAVVFEQGIMMLDIFRAHDINGTGCFSRQEVFNIVSPLLSLPEESWALVMYKYCRPFEPHVVPYRPFADDIDCNSREPDEVLIPLNYINTSSHNKEDRKKLTWIIERIGRTCTLEQIQQLFSGVTDHPNRLLNEGQFLKAISQIRFVTISEKELIFKSFNLKRDSDTVFEYERFWSGCRFVHMSFYMGVNTAQED